MKSENEIKSILTTKEYEIKSMQKAISKGNPNEDLGIRELTYYRDMLIREVSLLRDILEMDMFFTVHTTA